MHQQQTAFENIEGKKEIARDKQISPFPTMYSTQSNTCTPFVHIFDIIFLFAADWKSPKLAYEVKG